MTDEQTFPRARRLRFGYSALEHRAARSALAGPAEGEGGEAAAGSEDDAEPEEPDGEPPAYLISEARVEWREGQVLVGLLGHPMPTVDGVGEAVPVAGLTLTREQAHEALRMLADQAEQADWALPRRLGWLRSGAGE